MSAAPFLPLATDALIADTTHLTTEQFGAYLLLLCAQWRNNGQPLPDDDARLARIARCSNQRWTSKLRPVMAELFEINRCGAAGWSQKRLRETFKKVEKKIEVNRASGSLGGRAKSQKTKESDLATATDSLVANGYQPEPEPKPEPNTALSEEESSGKKPLNGCTNEVWGKGIGWLVSITDRPENQCRALIGKWLASAAPEEVLETMRNAHRNQPADPVQWITAQLLRGVPTHLQAVSASLSKEDWDERRLAEVRKYMIETNGGDEGRADDFLDNVRQRNRWAVQQYHEIANKMYAARK